MKHLDNVALLAVATTEVEATVEAIKYSLKEISFEEVLLISNINPDPSSKLYNFIEIEPFRNVSDWGKFIVFDLFRYINTDFIILIHADGFIVNPGKWNKDFLKYDFIGAPWPLPKDNFSYRDFYGNIIRVGNSVSLRSKKFLELPTKMGLSWDDAEDSMFHEDGFLTVQNRHLLEREGVKFAPLSIAKYFSKEATIPENKGIETFLFHQWFGENKNYPCFGSKKNLTQRIFSRLKNLFWQ